MHQAPPAATTREGVDGDCGTALPHHARVVRVLLTGALAATLLLAGCAPEPDPEVLRPEDTQGAFPGSMPTEPDPVYQRPEPGTCLRIKPEKVVSESVVGTSVACGKHHNARVLAAPMLPEGLDWSLSRARLVRLAARECADELAEVVGGTPRERARSVFRLLLFKPTFSQRQHGARWFRCDVAARTGAGRMVRLPSNDDPFLGKHGVPARYRHCRTLEGTSVTCDKPHAYRVAKVLDVAPKDPMAPYPSPQKFNRIAERKCRKALQASSFAWRYPGPLQWRSDGLVPLLCFRPD